MKLKYIPILAAITLATACTTQEMIAQAHDECAQIGYAITSPEYTECVERGYRQTATTQNAAIAATASTVITGAIFSAMY